MQFKNVDLFDILNLDTRNGKITNSVINLWIAEETNTEYITKTQKIIEEF